MTPHDFRLQLQQSKNPAIRRALDNVYRRTWPVKTVTVIEGRNGTEGDVRILLRSPMGGSLEITVEEKIISPDATKYPHLIIETHSNLERGTPGWIHQTHSDWLSVCRQPDVGLQVWLIPMQPLRDWFLKNGDRYASKRTYTQVGLDYYTTQFTPIPFHDADFRQFWQESHCVEVLVHPVEVPASDPCALPGCRDPRPDLVEDTVLWGRLLDLAENSGDETIFQVLYGMRCCGLRLEPGARGGYVLRPLIEEGVRGYWRTVAEYTRDRESWLVPYRDAVVRLLSALTAPA